MKKAIMHSLYHKTYASVKQGK